jgi:hypothetical protein
VRLDDAFSNRQAHASARRLSSAAIAYPIHVCCRVLFKTNRSPADSLHYAHPSATCSMRWTPGLLEISERFYSRIDVSSRTLSTRKSEPPAPTWRVYDANTNPPATAGGSDSSVKRFPREIILCPVNK